MIGFSQFAAGLKSRGGALAGAAAIAVFAVLLISLPLVLLFHAQNARIQSAMWELGRSRAQAAIEPVLRKRVAELRQRAATVHGAIPKGSGALAQSQLQQVLESFATQTGASIRSSQMLSPTTRHGFETVAIQYELAVPMSKLQDLAYAIETHVPYLFLDQIQISGTESGQSNTTTSRDPLLNVGWNVTAYRRSSAQ
jgi:hypothetical protein